MKKILFSFLVSTILIACQDNQTYTEHKSQNFSIKVRNDLSETDDLNDEAILQFKNEFQELYLRITSYNVCYTKLLRHWHKSTVL